MFIPFSILLFIFGTDGYYLFFNNHCISNERNEKCTQKDEKITKETFEFTVPNDDCLKGYGQYVKNTCIQCKAYFGFNNGNTEEKSFETQLFILCQTIKTGMNDEVMLSEPVQYHIAKIRSIQIGKGTKKKTAITQQILLLILPVVFIVSVCLHMFLLYKVFTRVRLQKKLQTRRTNSIFDGPKFGNTSVKHEIVNECQRKQYFHCIAGRYNQKDDGHRRKRKGHSADIILEERHILDISRRIISNDAFKDIGRKMGLSEADIWEICGNYDYRTVKEKAYQTLLRVKEKNGRIFRNEFIKVLEDLELNATTSDILELLDKRL